MSSTTTPQTETSNAPKGEPVQIPRSELARPRPQPNGCGATVSAAGRESGVTTSFGSGN